jgi:hypothetical protein
MVGAVALSVSMPFTLDFGLELFRDQLSTLPDCLSSLLITFEASLGAAGKFVGDCFELLRHLGLGSVVGRLRVSGAIGVEFVDVHLKLFSRWRSLTCSLDIILSPLTCHFIGP